MDIATISKVYSLFNNKKWNANLGHESVFTNFCQLLQNVTEPQRTLLLDLAERYIWLTFSEYQGRITQVFNSVETAKIAALKKIVLFPAMRPEEEEKTKSGHAMLFILRGIRPLLDNYQHIYFSEIEVYDYFKREDFTLDDAECIFILDDYLGSGDTVKVTAEQIMGSANIPIEKINVLSVASQQQAIDLLNGLGIKAYTSIVVGKGISDYYVSPELEEKVEIMEEIESLIPKNRHRFGYEQSEGLITMYRTPNNTFPIFWKDHRKNNETFRSPFPRF